MEFPSFSLENKTAIVTGASKGIGRAISISYAQAGANVALFARTEKELNDVAREIEKKGQKALPLVVDITKQDLVESAVQKVINQMGKVDILVNNAGLNIRKPALEYEEEDWNKIVDINMKSVFMMSKVVGKFMKKNNGGKIISVASVDGHVGTTTGVIYGMTKAAVIHMTKVLAVEWSKYNINVNAIGPGYVKTQITEEKLEDKFYYNYIMERTPIQRIGGFSDISGAAIYLASEASNYIAGQTLLVDGGISVFSY